MINFEKHKSDCSCTYCNDSTTCKALHYGLNVSKKWRAWNAWYVVKYWPHRYFRWTNHWFRLLSPGGRRWLKQIAVMDAKKKAERKQLEKILLSNADINDLTVECAEFHGNAPLAGVVLDLQVAVAAAIGKSHTESLENEGYRSEPNALTRETIEKSERGEDVESFDTVEELFENLDN